MSREQQETNDVQIDALNTKNLSNDREPVLLPRRTTLKETKMGVAIGSDGLIAINGRD